MAESSLNPAQELADIVHHLKGHLINSRDMGLEPPKFSGNTLSYLDKRPGGIQTLETLREHIGDCQRCGLSQGRHHLVFGEGASRARLVFVGEAPGRDEDLAGRPFVGEAGKLLTRIIENGMGLTRDQVYICNIIKCRPPDNRDPDREEINTCFPFLRNQIRLIRPEVICTLGRIAAQTLIDKSFKITEQRGKWFSFMDIPVMPTFHPAYLLRYPEAKRQVWQDIQEVMKKLGLEVKKNA
jgi:DNA polymerase